MTYLCFGNQSLTGVFPVLLYTSPSRQKVVVHNVCVAEAHVKREPRHWTLVDSVENFVDFRQRGGGVVGHHDLGEMGGRGE